MYAVGRRFFVEPLGVALSAEEKSMLGELQPAGVMLRKRNFVQDSPNEWLKVYRQLIIELRQASKNPKLIISLDHEGGRVHRLPESGATHFPYARFWPPHTKAIGLAMGQELKRLGIQLTFAPVADIDLHQENTVIAERSFSSLAKEVRDESLVHYRALRKSGLACCAKHFPGHGATKEDSHHTLPILPVPRQVLQKRELVPFRALIEAGIQAVMPAHMMVPALDPKQMTTASRKIIHDFLRKKLGFKGLVIADAMAMNAILPKLRDESFWRDLLWATGDIFLIVGDALQIKDALAFQEIAEKLIAGDKKLLALHKESLRRLTRFTQKMTFTLPRLVSARTLKANKKIVQSLDVTRERVVFHNDRF